MLLLKQSHRVLFVLHVLFFRPQKKGERQTGFLVFCQLQKSSDSSILSNWNGSFSWTVPTVRPLYAASQGSHIPCYNATQCLKKQCALMNCICKKKNKQYSTNLAAALYFLGSARERNWRSQGCHSYCIQGDQCESLSPERRQNKQTNKHLMLSNTLRKESLCLFWLSIAFKRDTRQKLCFEGELKPGWWTEGTKKKKKKQLSQFSLGQKRFTLMWQKHLEKRQKLRSAHKLILRTTASFFSARTLKPRSFFIHSVIEDVSIDLWHKAAPIFSLHLQ